jgi:hypothetical protein
MNGQFELLKWARENLCPWDEWTCHNAAMNGQFEMGQGEAMPVE